MGSNIKKSYNIRWAAFWLIVISSGLLGSCASKNTGLHFYLNESYAKSASQYEHVLNNRPNNKGAIMMLGWSYFKLKRYEEALMEFKKLMEINPDSKDALEGLGWTSYMMGQYKDAVSAFNELVSSDPVRTSDVEGLGYSHFKLGNWTVAKHYLQYGIQENPKSVDNHVIMGLVAINLYDKALAVSHFKTALKLSPDNPDALAGLKQLNQYNY